MPLDLARPVPDPLDPRIPPKALNRIVVHQPHPPMDLQRRIRHPREHLGCKKLGRGDLPVRGQPLIKSPCRGQRQPVGSVDLGDHVRDLKADTLKLRDLLAELLALGGVVDGHVKTPPRSPHGHGRHGEARRIKPGVHHRKAAIDLAQHLSIGNTAIIELKDRIVIAPVADRAIPVPHLEPGRPAIHQKTSDPLLRTLVGHVLAGRDEHDEEIRMGRARDKMLGPVDDPVAPVPDGGTLHPPHVRARIRLRHCKRIHPFAPYGR